MQSIENKWDMIKKSISQAVLLVSSFGYSGDTLTSNNALIPIAYYLRKLGNPDNYVASTTYVEDRKKIKKWLILSLLKKVFSGQPDNVIRPIRDILREAKTKEFPLDTIVDKFKGTNKSISFSSEDIDEFLLKLRYGKADTLSTLMLLYPSLDFSNKFHVDHIYPKSKFTKTYLRKKGVSENMLDTYIYSVNDISNLQLLPALINQEKLDKDFDVWFDENYNKDDDKIQYRTIHYIPDMVYSYDNFLDFLKQRKTYLRDKLKKTLL